MFNRGLLKLIAKKESVSLPFLKRQINSGKVVIPLNKKRQISHPTAIGQGLKVKINTNIGLSTNELDINRDINRTE